MSNRNYRQNQKRSRRGNTRQRRPNNSEANPLIIRSTEKDVRMSANAGMQPNLRVPLPFPSSPVHNRKFRFITNAAVATQAFTFSDLMKLMCFSTAVNTGYGMIACCRLRYVELWEPYQGVGTLTSLAGIVYEGSGGTNTGINLQFYGGAVAPDQPTHIYAPTPRNTLIGDWQQKTSSSTAFTLKNLDTGTIVDISMDFIKSDTDTVSAVGPFTISAASAGLTGIHPPSTSFVGVGLNTM